MIRLFLVRDYLARKQEQPEADDRSLIADSVCRRFRAILLTTLTTVGGLTPLMFETSTQAQFLIPMAASICFGLAFATLLILFVMPAYLSVHHSVGIVMRKLFSPPVRGACAGRRLRRAFIVGLFFFLLTGGRDATGRDGCGRARLRRRSA